MKNGHDDLFWILPGKLAGMSHPGHDEADLRRLSEVGIGAIVTLTEAPLTAGPVTNCGFEYLHLPIKDFNAPQPGQIERFVNFCDREIASGRGVAVHCMAGIGRTGVMLACYLVHCGDKPHKAIEKVRRIRPGALETAAQENAVYEFAASS